MSAQTQSQYPEAEALKQFVEKRNRFGLTWRIIFQVSTIVGIIALMALLYNIINSAFGYVAVQNAVEPELLVLAAEKEGMLNAPNPLSNKDDQELVLDELPRETLIVILEANVSAGLMRRFEADQPFAERTRENVLQLVQERVVKPRIVDTWSLVDSLFNQEEIKATVEQIPGGDLKFRSWLHSDFLMAPQSSTPELAGVRTALLGSLWTIFITIVIALPLGVGAAIYLEEYATLVANPRLRTFNSIIQTNINNLAGVPSIIYGMLGLAIFVRALEPLTSGTLFGLADPTTANGRTIVSAGLTLALLILPLIIINAQEAIRAVPGSLRQASLGLGATRWQTIWHHVLPSAIPGILTGNILSISRAIGETAPLVVIGASTFITVDPDGPFAKFTTLPIQIYQWTSRPQDEFRNIAAAAIVVLLILLLTLNASAVLLRNRYSRRSV